MELVDRYLQAIKTFLTGKNQDDILLELRESLLSQIDEKEQSLGRPPTSEEVESIIRESGPPFMVAARFGPHRSLIGPALFPFYWLALKVLLFVALVAQLIESSIRVIVNSDTSALFAIPRNLLLEAVWITGIFAVVEYALSLANVKWKPIRWNPKSLPKLRGELKVARRSESIAAIIFGLAGLVWLRTLPNSIFLAGQPDLVFAPIWSMMYRFFVLLAIAGVLRGIALLIRPHWAAFNVWSHLAMNAATLVTFYFLFHAGTWFAVSNASSNRPHWEAVVATLNQVFYYGLLVSVIGMAVAVAWDLYQCLRGKTAQAQSNGYRWRTSS
jgi:hypothetical protein